jgi:hypothetical protein
MTRLLLLAALLCACVPDNGPLMQPGQDCLFCHSANGGAQTWNAAGTVFQTTAVDSPGFEGAQVQITDADNKSFSLRTNLAGNFYTAESIHFPLKVCISANGTTACQQSALMQGQGSCNTCHGQSVFGATQPQLTAP